MGALQGEGRELLELPVLKNGSDNSKNNCNDFSAWLLGFSCSSFLRLPFPPLVLQIQEVHKHSWRLCARHWNWVIKMSKTWSPRLTLQ